MWKNKKAILFDLDGTLVDSMWLWYGIDVEYLGRFNLSVPSNLQQSIEGMSFTETATYFKERFSINASIDEIKEDWNNMAWDKYCHEVPLKDGVFEFIKECHSHNIKLGIASSNSRALIENVLKVHHIIEYFDCIITGCDVPNGKPQPDIYLKAASELNVAPKDCLVFEDIVSGIKSGINAGMEVCAVEDKYSVYQREEKRALSNYYIVNYYELLKNKEE